MGKAARPIPWAEVIQLRDYCIANKRWRDYLLVVVGASTAFRYSEWYNLKWSDLLDRDEIVLLQPKNKRKRRAIISPAMRAAIRTAYEGLEQQTPPSQRAHLKYDWAFPNHSPNRKLKTASWLTTKGASYALKRLCDAVGIEPISTHSLRKAWAIRCWELNGNTEAALIEISQWIGHSSPKTTMRYMGFTQQRQQGTIMALWDD